MVFDNKGRTTFHCAVRHIDVLRYLIIKCKCDPMATDQSTDRSTILHNAAINGLLDVLKYLISHHNCNPMATNGHGQLFFIVLSSTLPL